MSEWYEKSYKKRIDEAFRLRPKMRITVYGSFHPKKEKKYLQDVVSYLREQGFVDTDIVEGDLRPNKWDIDSYKISIMYLQESDVNFMIFTHDGNRVGVTTELTYVLENPKMCEHLGFCVVFNEIKDGRHAIGNLLNDKIMDLNAEFQHVQIVHFDEKKEVFDSILTYAVSYVKRLSSKLEVR